MKGPEVLDNTLKILQTEGSQVSVKVSALQEFQLFIREGDPIYIKQNFKYVLLYTLVKH